MPGLRYCRLTLHGLLKPTRLVGLDRLHTLRSLADPCRQNLLCLWGDVAGVRDHHVLRRHHAQDPLNHPGARAQRAHAQPVGIHLRKPIDVRPGVRQRHRAVALHDFPQVSDPFLRIRIAGHVLGVHFFATQDLVPGVAQPLRFLHRVGSALTHEVSLGQAVYRIQQLRVDGDARRLLQLARLRLAVRIQQPPQPAALTDLGRQHVLRHKRGAPLRSIARLPRRHVRRPRQRIHDRHWGAGLVFLSCGRPYAQRGSRHRQVLRTSLLRALRVRVLAAQAKQQGISAGFLKSMRRKVQRLGRGGVTRRIDGSTGRRNGDRDLARLAGAERAVELQRLAAEGVFALVGKLRDAHLRGGGGRAIEQGERKIVQRVGAVVADAEGVSLASGGVDA